MRLFRVLTVLLSLAIAGSALAQTGSGVHDDRWYLGGSLGYVDLDRDRLTESSDIVYGINIGRFFLPRLSLDLRLDRYEPSFLSAPAGTSRDFDLFSYGLIGRYHFADPKGTSPYVMFGTGLQEHDSYLDDGRDIFGTFGVGLYHPFGHRAFMRLEAEYRYDNDRDTFGTSGGLTDLMLHLGLNVRLGRIRRHRRHRPGPSRHRQRLHLSQRLHPNPNPNLNRKCCSNSAPW